MDNNSDIMPLIQKKYAAYIINYELYLSLQITSFLVVKE